MIAVLELELELGSIVGSGFVSKQGLILASGLGVIVALQFGLFADLV